jgi:hypothetical protein
MVLDLASIAQSITAGCGAGHRGLESALATGAMSAGSPSNIAGMPAVAGGGRSGYGAPRYGVKPKVMPPIPKPTLT